MLLLNKMGYVSLEWFTRIDWSKYALPLIFIFIGLILLLSRQKRDETFINPDIDMVMDDNAHLYINEMFSGHSYRFSILPLISSAEGTEVQSRLSLLITRATCVLFTPGLINVMKIICLIGVFA